ncbi:hypothetical protein ACE4Z6_27980, partial [Salmonella enterica]|uniref:hypothetical protein n=1 Tax=Salmonella enterica TaxID=28901 RepID=UPI003D2BC39F
KPLFPYKALKIMFKKKIYTLIYCSSIILSSYAQQPYQLLIGTYTKSGRSAGIHWISWDTTTKESVTKSVTEVTDPSYL